MLSFSPNSQKIGQLFAKSPIVPVLQILFVPCRCSYNTYSMVYSTFLYLFATLLSNRLHHSYLIHHTHSFSHCLFPIHIPFNDPLSNAYERNSHFYSPSTFSIQQALSADSFFPISYFQITRTQLEDLTSESNRIATQLFKYYFYNKRRSAHQSFTT